MLFNFLNSKKEKLNQLEIQLKEKENLLIEKEEILGVKEKMLEDLSDKVFDLQMDLDRANEHLLKIKPISKIILGKVDNYSEKEIEEIFNQLRELDDEGFKYLREIEKESGLNTHDVYTTFYYEDNMGYFEEMNGYGLSKYIEKIKFAEIIDSTFHGMYEECEYSTNYVDTQEYKDFIKKVKLNTIKSLLNSI